MMLPMPDPATQTTQQTRGPQHTQQADVQQTQQPEAQRGGGNAQAEYNRQLAGGGKPADKARAALKAAGLPIGQYLPDNVTAFDQKPDGTFTLTLPNEVRAKMGDVTLVLGTQVSGKLSNGEMASVSGIKGEKKVAFITASANVLKVRREDDDLVVNTDNSAAREIRIPVSSLGGVS